MGEDLTEVLSKQMNGELESKVEESETDTARLRRILNGPYDLRQCLQDMSHDLNNALTCISGYAELANNTPENIAEYNMRLIKEAERIAAVVCAYSIKSGSLMFTESIKHNLNNVLTSVIGFAQLCRSNPVNREQYFEIISSQVEAAANLVKKLQDFVSAFHPKAYYSVGVACALENALNKIGNEARAKILAQDVGDLLFVKADSKDLGLVYKNLLQNALEAGSQKISIAAHAQNGTILTKISDDGRGISEENLKTIFEPFFSTQNDVGHLGLGLATSKAIVEKYGGRILVESIVEKGSTFTVELPAAK